ncbi:MAG: hypothetical protein QOF11_232 [Chloroflexota bacterium]|jgi:EAL domain-containing protein (putative c-di-GMP-specific phosphodiesterase class I)/CHASE3 domain sensor protein|nr:hypothetical protein [Chloroflexota bacterium]
MTPYNRVLLVVGGAAVIVCLATVTIYLQTNAANDTLQTQQGAADSAAALGDELVTAVHEQHDALGDFLLSGDPRPLARYRQAVVDEGRVAAEIRAEAGNLAGVDDALVGVAAENDAWRATMAEPAIAAIQSGSTAAIRAAIETQIAGHQSSDAAISRFVDQLDEVAGEFGSRFDELDRMRAAATGFGLAIELLAAGLSLWFVRRYGLAVAHDSRRRGQASAERIAIIASLRQLRTQSTPEATAMIVAEAMDRLPGNDAAGVFECTGDRLLALAIVAMPGFPIQSGDVLSEEHSRYLLERSGSGPWAELLVRGPGSSEHDQRLAAIGIRSRAVAPIQADGELVGLVALATTDEDHARHLVEDLPAVGEFASVAETILAPALVARRGRGEKRQRIGATIAATAFGSVFQPIVDLGTGTIVGFEALTRFDDGQRPDVTFATALECGMGLELEAVTLDLALREARLLPRAPWLSVNVSPAFLAQGGTITRVLAQRSRPVVLEVTEHEAIEAYAPLRQTMLELGPGVRLAVDDAGAGVANFNHLVELRPNFVKIDAGLVHGVDGDPSRRAVVVGLIHFAVEAGSQVIAEGIETEAERAVLIELGVTLGQGYLLGKPAPADAWVATIPRRVKPVPRQPRAVRRPATRAS